MKDHDYEPTWDYEIDPKPPKASMGAFLQAKWHIKCITFKLNDFFDFFDTFSIHFVSKDQLEDDIARYVNGTYSEPVFVIDAQKFEEILIDQDSDTFFREATKTLWHEMRHAVQDYKGELDKEGAEQEAEDFAEEMLSWLEEGAEK